MSSLYEKNLQALRGCYPHAAQILQQIAQYTPHERSAFSNELPRLPERVEQIVLLGVGKGDLLLRLWEKTNPRNLVVIEKDFHTLHDAFQRYDLTPLIKNPHVFWVFAVSRHELEQHIEYIKTSLPAHGFQLVKNPNMPPEDHPYYAMIHQELKRIVERESFSLKARLARGPLIQRNLTANLPDLLRSYSLDDVKNLFQTIPAIIVAAGPSLDRNVNELKEAQSKALILCVDTAVRTLHKHGIEPHVIVTSDPSPENAKHLQDVEISAHTALAFSADTYYNVPRSYRTLPHRIGIIDNSSRLSYWLRDRMDYETIMERPMHVGETAIRLARVMGCNPIIFTGLDLALSNKQGRTHAQESVYSSSIQSMSDKEIEVITTEGKNVKHAITHVEDYHGNNIPTFYSFKVYLERLQALIQETPGIDWIDTSGGAKKEGARAAGLNEVLGSLPVREENFGERFYEKNKTRLKGKKQGSLDTLQDGIKRLIESRDLFEKILQREIDKNEAQDVWQDFLTNEDIRAFLDHAVFHFQLEPPLERIAENKKKEFLYSRLTKAHEIMQMFVPLWEMSLKECSLSI